MVVTDVRAGKPQALRFTPLTPAGDFMIRLVYAQRSLVEVLLPDGEKLWDPVLRRIDAELEDEGLLDVTVEALARRRPLSSRRGRPGTPATVVLRMLVLKHLHDWTFDECEREVRANLVYRAFCRIEGERVPDAKTVIRLAQVLDGPVLKAVLVRLVAIARARRVVRGRRLRVDTTVVVTELEPAVFVTHHRRQRVRDPSRVERRTPPVLAEPGQLEIVLLPRHAGDHSAEAKPAATCGAS
jgi:hypothetical protein